MSLHRGNQNFTLNGGIKNGLILYLDATSSFVSSSYGVASDGVNWNSIAGPNATLVNGAVYNLTSGSVYFDGSNDYVNVGTISGLNSIQTKIVWFKCTSVSPGDNRYLIDEGNNINWVQIYSPSGQPGIRAGTNGSNVFDSITKVYSNIWYNVCIVSTNSNVSIYINGVLDSSNAVSSGESSGNIVIGDYSGLGARFIGYIGSVQIFNRALSLNEVTASYSGSKGRFGL